MLAGNTDPSLRKCVGCLGFVFGNGPSLSIAMKPRVQILKAVVAVFVEVSTFVSYVALAFSNCGVSVAGHMLAICWRY